MLPAKCQLISKADWRAIDSPKKRTDEFVMFAFLLFMAKKSNSFVRVFGESTARQSAFRFYLTFKGQLISKCIFCVSNSPKKRTCKLKFLPWHTC